MLKENWFSPHTMLPSGPLRGVYVDSASGCKVNMNSLLGYQLDAELLIVRCKADFKMSMDTFHHLFASQPPNHTCEVDLMDEEPSADFLFRNHRSPSSLAIDIARRDKFHFKVILINSEQFKGSKSAVLCNEDSSIQIILSKWAPFNHHIRQESTSLA